VDAPVPAISKRAGRFEAVARKKDLSWRQDVYLADSVQLTSQSPLVCWFERLAVGPGVNCSQGNATQTRLGDCPPPRLARAIGTVESNNYRWQRSRLSPVAHVVTRLLTSGSDPGSCAPSGRLGLASSRGRLRPIEDKKVVVIKTSGPITHRP
jgi:hypothetical protein